MAGIRQIVDGPSFAPLPYGLWEAVQKPVPADPHWQNGVTWSEWCGGGGTLYDECTAVTGTGGTTGAAPPQAAMGANITQDNRGATAFTVYAEFDCSRVGLSTGEAKKVALNALDRVEPWQVETAFWTGVAGKSGSTVQTTVFPHLAANAAVTDTVDSITLQTAASVVATGAGDDVVITLGQLEGALADCYHGKGMIHVPYEALATFMAWDLFEPDSTGALYSPAGHRVVVGSGYTGSGPDGSSPAAGRSWVYATGAMFGYRGDVHIPPEEFQSFDRVENTVRMTAQRTYVLGWECCHFAALVSLGVPT